MIFKTKKQDKLYIGVLCILFIVANYIDVYQTMYALNHPFLYEINSLWTTHFEVIYILKVFILPVLVISSSLDIYYKEEPSKKRGKAFIFVITIFMISVIFSNFIQLYVGGFI